MKRILFILFLFINLQQIFGQTDEILLSGLWKFKQGDDMNWVNPADQGDWRLMTVPAWDWGGEYSGYGWYAKDVMISKKETYFFNLGQVDDDCEVYFNGHKLNLYIHPTSPEIQDSTISSRWKIYRSYYIPKDLIDTLNRNHIAIRVWNTNGAQGGIRYGKIYIGKTKFNNDLPIELAGNWLLKQKDNSYYISFLNNKVIYQNQVWDYDRIEHIDDFIYIYIKTKSSENVRLIVKRADKGNFFIGTDAKTLELCGLFESDTDSVTKHTVPMYAQETPSSGRAIYKGYIKNFSNTSGNDGILQFISGTSMIEKLVPINSDGTFAVNIDLEKPTLASFRIPGINTAEPIYIAPQKTVFHLIDLAEFKIYVTSEFYDRKRLTMTMGDLMFENDLNKYAAWIASAPDTNNTVWKKFMNTAYAIASKYSTTDVQMNQIALFIAENYPRYKDDSALKQAKLWSAKTLLSTPDSHIFNSTLNTVMQMSGEKMQGLEYLVKALELAQKENNSSYTNTYKEEIKKYIAGILKKEEKVETTY
jgi:Glycosyl hydrolases family 2, sugar binding domain.